MFVDSLGQSVRGRDKMRAGWQGYYAFCPDYWVSHEEIFEDGNRVAVFRVGRRYDCCQWEASARK